jgi:hypothetical protein
MLSLSSARRHLIKDSIILRALSLHPSNSLTRARIISAEATVSMFNKIFKEMKALLNAKEVSI